MDSTLYVLTIITSLATGISAYPALKTLIGDLKEAAEKRQAARTDKPVHPHYTKTLLARAGLLCFFILLFAESLLIFIASIIAWPENIIATFVFGLTGLYGLIAIVTFSLSIISQIRTYRRG